MNKWLSNGISALASGASIVSLAFIKDIPFFFKILLVIVGVWGTGYLIYYGIKKDKVNERVCKSDKEIKDTMKEIINSSGKVAIMSRDLSWVDAETEVCLALKKDNMLICVQQESELTRRLAKTGTKIIYYGHIGFEPISRFTIIRYNKKDCQVAIANTESSVRKQNNFRHIIYQTKSSGDRKDEWINTLAKDMISLCKLMGEEMDINEDK